MTRLEEDEPAPAERIKALTAVEKEATARPNEADSTMERSDVVERAPTAVEEEATARPKEVEPTPVEWTIVPKSLEEEATTRPDEAKPAVKGSDVVERATIAVEEEATARLEEDEPLSAE